MPKISAQTTQHLQTAKALAEATADALTAEATRVKNLQHLDPDILYVREFPEHLQRAVERGGRRLDYAASAVRRISTDVDKVLQGAVPTPFGRQPDYEVPTTRHHGKRIAIDPPRIRAHVAPIRRHVDFSDDMRRALGKIEKELAEASTQKGVSAMIETVGTARETLQNFAYWIQQLVDRVRAVLHAIEDWDAKGRHGGRPPLPKAKPKQPGRGTKPGVSGPAPSTGSTKWPGQHASKQQVACYLAAQARKYNLPPVLPVVCALVESNLGNIGYGDRDSVGLFQIRADMHPAPPGFGSASGKIQSASWWVSHPDAQMKWFALEARRVSHGTKVDQATIGLWAANTERPAAQYRGRYAERYFDAKKLVANCTQYVQTFEPGGVSTSNIPGFGGAGVSKPAPTPSNKPGGKNPKNPGGGHGTPKGPPKPSGKPGGQNREKTEAQKGLAIALQELAKGVRETNGNNAGPRIDMYLASTNTASGNFWCAAFVHWCLQKAGFKFPSGYWAAVREFRRVAQAGNSMFIVGRSEARAGDLILWGNDHIGIVESVKNGVIHYVAGNENNAVARGTESSSSGGITIIRPRDQ